MVRHFSGFKCMYFGRKRRQRSNTKRADQVQEGSNKLSAGLLATKLKNSTWISSVKNNQYLEAKEPNR
eukprot:1178677-Prorocentrum_minimum.AAC.1